MKRMLAMVAMLVMTLFIAGEFGYIAEAYAKRSGGFSSSRSSSSRSFSSSSSKSTSSWKKSAATSSKKSSYKKSASSGIWSKKKTNAKPAAKSTTVAKKKGFGGTSVFDKKQSTAIRAAKTTKAKAQFKADNSKFKKPAAAYTAKTAPKSVKSNPIFAKTKVRSTDNYSTYSRNKSTYYNSRGWDAPSYAYGGSSSFGAMDAVFMYMILDSMNDASYAKMAYNQSNTEEFKQWKAEAAKQAETNAELKAKLDAMDNKLAGMSGPKDPSYLPDGVDPTVVLAAGALAAASSEKVQVRYAAGSATGNYTRSGNMLKNVAKTIDVKVMHTAGTMENINMYMDGKTDAMVVQADGLDVYGMVNPDAIKKMEASAVTLYKESIQMIANESGGIKKIKDFDENTILYVGSKGSGNEVTWQRMQLTDHSRYGKVKVRHTDYSDADAALNLVADNPNAVIMFVSGLNSTLMKRAEARAEKDGFRLVEVNDKGLLDATDRFGDPLYASVDIPAKVYPNLQKGFFFGNDVKTIAVSAMLVISDEWKKKHGEEAFDDLSAAVVEMQPIMYKRVNGELEM